MSLRIDHLLNPVSAAKPAGEDGRRLTGGISKTIDDLRTGLENAAKLGKEPDWQGLRQDSEAILSKASKHLDAAFLWTVASVQLEGLDGLQAGLSLQERLLATFWETLHPLADAGDPYERANILSEMGIAMFSDPGPCRLLHRLSLKPLLKIGKEDEWTIGEVLAAINPAAWPPSGRAISREQLRSVCSGLPEEDLRLRREAVTASLRSLKAIQGLFSKNAAGSDAPRLAALEAVLVALESILQGNAQQPDTAASGMAIPEASGPSAGAGELVSAERTAALSALGLLQAYLRKNEPASPLLPLIQLIHEIRELSFSDALGRIPPSDLKVLQDVFGGNLGGSESPLSVLPPKEALAGPVKTREDAEHLLRVIDGVFSRTDPGSPVLPIIRLCRTALSLTYHEACARLKDYLKDQKMEDFIRILNPGKTPSAAQR